MAIGSVIPNPTNLASLSTAQGFRIDGAVAAARTGGAIALNGDFNGDGFDDMLISAPREDSGTGAVYLVFGRASGFGNIDLANLGTQGFRIAGSVSNASAGTSVGFADVNGDGLSDIITGQPNAQAAYVIFGGANTGNLSLGSLGSQGITIQGTNGGTAFATGAAGDFNGDGIADFLVGDWFSSPNGRSLSGSAYVIFGRSDGLSSTDLTSLSLQQGIRIDGALASDRVGYNLSAAGDVNGDGIADILIGAQTASYNGRANSGSVYVVFGRTTGPATIDLASLGTQGFRIDGAAASDQLGFSLTNSAYAPSALTGIGDLNGDGFGDILLGASQADNNSLNNSGSAYVIFGKASGFSTLDLASLTATQGFRIDGPAALANAGFSVAAAGDMNGDGYADFILGAWNAPGSTSTKTGAAYLIYGAPSGNTNINLASLGSRGIQINGAAADDSTGYAVAGAGDINGDGRYDLLIDATLADNNSRTDSGSATLLLNQGSLAAIYEGTTLADDLDGTSGNDEISGGGNNDTIAGNGGDDLLDGGAGIDTASYRRASAAVTVSLASQGTDQITGGAGTDRLSNFENLLGSAFNDTLTGDAGSNTIEGGAGHDVLNGGGGSDTASYAGSAAGVFVGLLAQGSAQNTQGAGTDTLSNFENLLGSRFNDTLGGDGGLNILTGGQGNDVLFGDAGDDTLLGGAGNDILYGGAGNDSMVGGTGDDQYVVDAVGDVVVESAGGGFDTAFVTVAGWTAAANLEAVYLYGSVTVQLGSGGADVLVGNTGGAASSLDGSGGDDVLWGGGGNDILTGGTGNDVLRGQVGDDVLIGGAGNDQLVGGVGADRFVFDVAAWGYDQIFDFSRAEGDQIDMRGSGVTSMAGFSAVYAVGGSTVLTLGAARVDVYGVASLQASDFIFV